MDEEVKFTLRVPKDLRDELAKIAKKQDRSMHNLILRILKEYVENER